VRREFLAAGVAGLGAGTAGCTSLFGSSDRPDVSSVTFSFAYRPSAEGGPAVRIEHASGDGLPAGEVRIRTSDGDSALWSELGSTSERADEDVTTGASARVGPEVVNWPSAVPPTESVTVLYVPGEQSVTELNRFDPPTPTPTATPTPTPTDAPTPTESPTPHPGLVTGFEGGDLSAWTVAKRGASGSAAWSVTDDHPVSGEYAAMYRGDRQQVLASVSGLDTYPSRGDTVEFGFYKDSADATGWFGFGVQSVAYEAGYRLRVRNHNWANHAETAKLVRLDGDEREKTVLDTVDYEPAAHAGERLRWEVRWGDPTIEVRAFDSEGERLVSLSAADETYDDGGVAIAANASDPATVYADRIRITDSSA